MEIRINQIKEATKEEAIKDLSNFIEAYKNCNNKTLHYIGNVFDYKVSSTTECFEMRQKLLQTILQRQSEEEYHDGAVHLFNECLR